MLQSPSVEKCYDRIALSWDRVRGGPSKFLGVLLPFIECRFSRYQGAKVLDAGCGTARNSLFLAGLFPNFRFSCCDLSCKMISIGREKALKAGIAERFGFAKSDVTGLPYEDSSFDLAICIAVLHHLRKEESRRRAFEELFRVTAPKGVVIVTVWNKDQEKFDGVSGNDSLVPWNKGVEKVLRYYYFFTESELQGMAKSAGFRVLDFFFEKDSLRHKKRNADNLCLVLEKPA